MDSIQAFDDFLLALFRQLAPETFKNPAYQYLFTFAYKALFLILGLAVYTRLMKNVRDVKSRAKISLLLAVATIDVIYLIVILENRTPLDVLSFLFMVGLNILIAGIYFFIGLIKNNPTVNTFDSGKDLCLKSDSPKHFLMRLCPGCGNRTISQPQAAKSPQTCGECGRCYRIYSIIPDGLVLGILILLQFADIYFFIEGKISHEAALNCFWGLILSLFVFQLRPRKLVEVKND